MPSVPPKGSLFIPENSEGFISGEIKIDSSLRIATSGQMQPARIAIILLGMGGERRKRKRRKGTPNPAASTGSHSSTLIVDRSATVVDEPTNTAGVADPKCRQTVLDDLSNLSFGLIMPLFAHYDP
jgi:hypothetical protein